MGHPHCCLQLVDVLAALATGPERIHPHVFHFQIDLVGVRQLGHHVDRGKRGVATFVGVERGDPHQPMHAALGLGIPVGIVAADQQRHALGAGFLARLDIDHAHVKPAGLAPATIHPQQHVRPVTAFRAAGPGVDAQERVARVVRFAEEVLHLEIVQPLLGRLDFAGEFFLGIAEIQHDLGIGNRALQRGQGIEFATDPRRFIAYLAGGRLVRPEIRRGHAPLQLGQVGLHPVDVKETSSTPRDVVAGR